MRVAPLIAVALLAGALGAPSQTPAPPARPAPRVTPPPPPSRGITTPPIMSVPSRPVQGDKRALVGEVTLRSRTELVVVPVVVKLDENTGSKLSAEDFTLLEDRHERPIAAVEEVTTTAGPLTAAEKPSGGEFSNFIPAPERDKPRRLTILALDQVNACRHGADYTRLAITKFFANYKDHETVAVVRLRAAGMEVIQPFTNDVATLITAAKLAQKGKQELSRGDERDAAESLVAARKLAPGAQLNPGVQASLAAPMADDTTDIARSLLGIASDPTPRERLAIEQYAMQQCGVRTMLSLDGLRQLAKAFAGVPGRKSLIWITHGVSYNPWSCPSALDAFEETVHELSNANIAVYPLDDHPYAGAAAMESFMAEYDNLFSFAFGSLMPIESVAREDGKWAMARDTGATTCGDIMGGLDWCLERATRDISHYYQLSYYVDKTTRPGWHKLRVKSRREGMKVVSWRRGYMLQQSDDEVVRKIEMVGAINSPLDYTGLALTLKFSAARPGAVPFELRISARPDLIDETNNHMSLEVLWLAQDKAGPGDNLKQRATHKPRMTQRLEGKMKPASAEQIRSEGITYRNHLQLASGNYRVHFVVRNNLTGAIGSVWTSVAVP